MQQYQQWKNSWHARAASPGLIGQLTLFDEETIRDCLGCHAPRQNQQVNFFRDQTRKIQAVDCASCHMRAGQRFGPRELAITPHGPVKTDPLFSSSQFCKGCHQFAGEGILVNGKPLQNTYEEWKASRYPAQGMTCQSCHMPESTHEFKGVHDPEMLRSGLAVLASKTGTELSVILKNQGAGHALPTYITPRIRLLWKGDDGSVQTIAVIQRKMDWNAETGWTELFDTRLMPDESRQLSIKLATNITGTIEAWVDPDADYHDRVYPAILNVMKEAATANTAVEQIKQAWVSSSHSSYLILQLRCGSREDHECETIASEPGNSS